MFPWVPPALWVTEAARKVLISEPCKSCITKALPLSCLKYLVKFVSWVNLNDMVLGVKRGPMKQTLRVGALGFTCFWSTVQKSLPTEYWHW